MRGGWRQRRRLGLPEAWREITAARVVLWAALDEADRVYLGELMDDLIVGKRWEAAKGFALTDEVRTVIAAQASLLILGLDSESYRGVGSIIVHPTTMTLRGARPGPARGVVTDAPHPDRGRNVVFHEFAHKLDMLDDLIDGTPPLPDPAARDRWIEVCTAEYELLRAGEGGDLLSDYAAVNPGEFFAVATEVFFGLPGEMRDQKPALYGVLREFYRQDPATRWGR